MAQSQRSMFKKLPQELLTEANEALQQQVLGLETELYMRSAPRIAEVQTCLSRLTQAANNGNQQAKQMLRGFFEAWEAARAASSNIVIPTERPAHFEAPTHPEGWSKDDEPVHG